MLFVRARVCLLLCVLLDCSRLCVVRVGLFVFVCTCWCVVVVCVFCLCLFDCGCFVFVYVLSVCSISVVWRVVYFSVCVFHCFVLCVYVCVAHVSVFC